MELENIKKLILEDDPDQAIALLEQYIINHPESDEAFYLKGNAYRKKNDFRMALNNYLMAMDINPDSPAVQAHNNLINILNFYNKDMYNH